MKSVYLNFVKKVLQKYGVQQRVDSENKEDDLQVVLPNIEIPVE